MMLLPNDASRIIAVYADGGVIGANPSPIGGTWAYCWVDTEGRRLYERSGVVVPVERACAEPAMPFPACAVGLPSVTNNLSEFVALARCLRSLPDGWSGDVYSDSQITLGRFFRGWRCEAIPDGWAEQIPRIIARLGSLRPHLLDGHPTKAQLASGVGKRGNPCSEHNVWCDEECGHVALRYRIALEVAERSVVG